MAPSHTHTHTHTHTNTASADARSSNGLGPLGATTSSPADAIFKLSEQENVAMLLF